VVGNFGLLEQEWEMKAKYKSIVLLAVAMTTGLDTRMVNADLVAHWELDETAGNVATDSSGKGNSGILKGSPARVAGRVGGALDFDGLDDFIDVDARIVEGSFSVALWLSHNKAEGFGPLVQNKAVGMGSVRLNLGTSDKFGLNFLQGKGNKAATRRLGQECVVLYSSNV
jgi:hypothetical protein